MHSINTGKQLQLHRPIANLTAFQTAVYYANINIINKLPECIKDYCRIKSSLYWEWKGFLLFDPFIQLMNF